MNTESLVWKQQSKEMLKGLIEKRIRSIIGITMENVEDLDDNKLGFSEARNAILKVCNDITRKLVDDLSDFTISKNIYQYNFKSVGGNS